MKLRRLRSAARIAGEGASKLVSMALPYQPMGQGAALLDAQYEAAEWDYLRSLEEVPRLGVVSSYCRALGAGGAILEIGCGEALLFEHLDSGKYAHFMGIDISDLAIARTRRFWSDSVEFRVADAELFVPDRKFDLIVFNEVLEYFSDPWALVRRYEQFAAKDAHFIVSMFAGLETARTAKIWRGLGKRYRQVAHARLSTKFRYVWNVKAYAACPVHVSS
jgi:ubiquinone/menaquinone biosynthesis C-methylase UbiE